MKKSTPVLLAVIIVGEALIWTVFILLVGDVKTAGTAAWIGMGVAQINFLLLFLDLPLFFLGEVRSFSAKIPLLGISMFSQSLYFFVSVGAYLLCIRLGAGIIWHVVFQGGMVFYLVLSLFLSMLGMGQVATVVSLDRLASAREGLARAKVRGGAYPLAKDFILNIEKCEEICRYISPVDSAEARKLEDSITANVVALEQIIESAASIQSWSIASAEAQDLVVKLERNLAERKLLRN